MIATEGIDGSATVVGWSKALGELHRRIGRRFCRSEARERVKRYLLGLLGQVERKNGWRLAEAIGERDPQGAQRERPRHRDATHVCTPFGGKVGSEHRYVACFSRALKVSSRRSLGGSFAEAGEQTASPDGGGTDERTPAGRGYRRLG